MRKRVVFIADSLDNAYKFQQVLSGFDVDIEWANGAPKAVAVKSRLGGTLCIRTAHPLKGRGVKTTHDHGFYLHTLKTQKGQTIRLQSR